MSAHTSAHTSARTQHAYTPARKPPAKANVVAGDNGHGKPKPAPASVPAPLKATEMPMVSAMERSDMNKAIQLLTDDLSYAEQEAAIKEARRQIKDEIAQLAAEYKMPGMRWGQMAATVRITSRKTLNKKALVENGCSAEIVARSYVEGKPYTEVRVVDLSKGCQQEDQENEGA